MTKKTKWEVNAFQVPNVLVDEHISKLSGNAFKLLVLIIRQTKGWNKKRDSISASRMANVLNLKLIRNVYPYIKELENLDLVKVYKKIGRVNQYSLHIPVSKKGTASEDTSVKNEHYPVSETSTSTSVKNKHSLKESKETIEKEIYIDKSQAEIIDSFIPNDSSEQTIRKKYPTISVTSEVIEDLTDTFKDKMRNRQAEWTDIQSCFRNYVKGDYIQLTRPTLVVDARPKVSYNDRLRIMKDEASLQIIEGEVI